MTSDSFASLLNEDLENPNWKKDIKGDNLYYPVLL